MPAETTARVDSPTACRDFSARSGDRAIPTTTSLGAALRPGLLVQVTAAASVQFAARPIMFRIARIEAWSTYEGWCWISGYELNSSGIAVERRTIFVQPRGLLGGDGIGS